MGCFFLQAQNQKDQFYQRLEECINWYKHCFTDCSENWIRQVHSDVCELVRKGLEMASCHCHWNKLFLSFCCYYSSLPRKAHLWCSELKMYLQLGGIPEQELKKLCVNFFLCSFSAFSPHSFTVFWYLLKLLRLVYESAIFIWFHLFFL